MHEITLAGCKATPLASYLKALGVLRLLSADQPDTRGYWQHDTFVLRTSLEKESIVDFFLNRYQPTPIMAPWNGGSGFYKNDNKDALQAITHSTTSRLAAYRATLDIAEQALQGVPRDTSPKGDDKARLLERVRAQLTETALKWFDASVSLSGQTPQYPPLLGTGGNDGRLDFTNNFMQRLGDVISLADDHAPVSSNEWLSNALFGHNAPGLVKNRIGQFSPGQAGGPNASTGFEANASINPWDFVLMIEGSLVFAATSTRRHADDPSGVLSFPFTVRAVGAGSGNIGESDTGNARGELWLPLWSTASSNAEIHALMAEGRVTYGRKPARDALDFVRAVHHLGGYRGIQSFQRYGLLMRSGKAYLATPLARVEVDNTPHASWLDELEHHDWLSGTHGFRRFAKSDHAANCFHTLGRRLEDMVFALSGKEPSKAEAQAMLALVGDIQAQLTTSKEAMAAVNPVPRLSSQWVTAADDGTPAFRIAKALAGLHGVGEIALPLRAQLFPVERVRNRWVSTETNDKARVFNGYQGALPKAMAQLLVRRLWLADKFDMDDKPLDSAAGVTTDDLMAFLQNPRMDQRIHALLLGLSLCRIPENTDHAGGQEPLPAAFALLKLSLTPNRALHSLDRLPDTKKMPVPQRMLAALMAGQGQSVVTTAWRRLQASGLGPVFASGALPNLAGVAPQRLAAALLIPLRFGATAKLARQVLTSTDNTNHAA